MQTVAAIAQSGLIDYLNDPNLLLNTLIEAMGGWMVVIVALIVFIESGVLFPVLPGDTMIFALGILHDDIPGVPLWVTFVFLLVAAILGNMVGYWLGARFGRGLFRDDRRFLSTKHLQEAERFFEKYGGPALVAARFVPFVRTFVPLVAGMVRYNYAKFLVWNVVGAVSWILSFLAAGYLLGGIPAVRNNVEIIALAMLMVSAIPMAWGLFKKLRERWAVRRALKRGLKVEAAQDLEDKSGGDGERA